MRDIHICNFRCYEDKQISFRQGINLLIGDNASGKTSLLRACNLVTNSFFCGYSDENTVWISATNDDFRNTGIAEQPVTLLFHPSETDYLPFTSNSREFRLGPDVELKIEKKSKKNSRNLSTGLKYLREYSSEIQHSSHIIDDNKNIRQVCALPIYACFSTEDIHSVRKINKERFTKYHPKPSFGYYECSDCRGLLEFWMKRMLVLKAAKKGDVELSSVCNAVELALGQNGCGIINSVSVRHNEGKVYFSFTDGRESEYSFLSDGYRRLVNIVVDIAFRCAILNGRIYGEDCISKSFGTVIIDEIDEHLHPALQVSVLKSLHRAFPLIQFIVSTHSPLVMSSVNPEVDGNGVQLNAVYKLGYADGEYFHQELNINGMDASTIIESVMNVPSRDIEIDGSLRKIEELIDSGDIEQAKSRLLDLRNRVSDGNPDITRLDTMISFWEKA